MYAEITGRIHVVTRQESEIKMPDYLILVLANSILPISY